MKSRLSLSLAGMVAAACLLLVVSGISCRKPSDTGTLRHSIPLALPPSGTNVTAASNQFAFDLFHIVLQTDNSATNKMISPFSIYMALAMTDNGAANATLDSINYTLRLGDLPLADLNIAAHTLIAGLPLVDSSVNLYIANAIWYNPSITVEQPFLQTMDADYLATVRPLNMNNQASVDTINQWTATATHQMIKQLITAPTSAPLLLADAIYFKGSWTAGFEASATSNASFTNGGGIMENVPFMTMPKGNTLPYLQNDSLTLVQLPYGNQQYSMYAMMPEGNFSVANLATLLNPSSFARWQSDMAATPMQLYLPKFTFSYSLDNMAGELGAMGMGIAFGNSADFSALSPTPLAIGRVIHKTAIDVDETGSAASAVTGVVMRLTMSPNEPLPIPVHFNQPFLYVIQEKTSGEILFIGELNDPQETGS